MNRQESNLNANEIQKTGTNTSQKTRALTSAALLVAIGSVLMYFDFPLPLLPPFLKIDLSNVAVLVGGFLLGPVVGTGIAALKSLIAVMHSTSGGVGELSDFLCAAALMIPSAWYYMKHRTKKGAIIGCALGTVSATVVGAFSNLYLIIPFYSKIMPMDAIWSACAAINPIVVDLQSYILYGATPFNLIKCAVISIVTILIYKTISRLAHIR